MPKDEKAKDEKNIPLRVTENEHRTIRTASVLAGKPNMHQYVRDVVLRDARRVLTEHNLPIPGEGDVKAEAEAEQ